MEHRPHQPRKRPPAGADPGTLTLERSRAGRMRLLRFDEGGCDVLEDASVEDCARMLQGPGTLWVELALPDRRQLEGLRDLLQLHALAVADLAHPNQKPRFSTYRHFDLLLAEAWAGGGLHQVALCVGDRWLLTVAETAVDLFAPIRERLAEGVGVLRARSPAFLATALLATLIDGYFEPIEKAREEIEQLEDRILTRREAPRFERLHWMRQSMLQLRRAIEPLRESVVQAARDDGARWDDEARLHLRESGEDLGQLLAMLEATQGGAASLGDLMLSVVGSRTNEVVTFLTLVSTLFLPMTFLTGIWGMNFDTRSPLNMPELEWHFGYLFAWFAIVASASGMLLYFRRRGWLARPERWGSSSLGGEAPLEVRRRQRARAASAEGRAPHHKADA